MRVVIVAKPVVTSTLHLLEEEWEPAFSYSEVRPGRWRSWTLSVLLHFAVITGIAFHDILDPALTLPFHHQHPPVVHLYVPADLVRPPEPSTSRTTEATQISHSSVQAALRSLPAPAATPAITPPATPPSPSPQTWTPPSAAPRAAAVRSPMEVTAQPEAVVVKPSAPAASAAAVMAQSQDALKRPVLYTPPAASARNSAANATDLVLSPAEVAVSNSRSSALSFGIIAQSQDLLQRPVLYTPPAARQKAAANDASSASALPTAGMALGNTQLGVPTPTIQGPLALPSRPPVAVGGGSGVVEATPPQVVTANGATSAGISRGAATSNVLGAMVMPPAGPPAPQTATPGASRNANPPGAAGASSSSLSAPAGSTAAAAAVTPSLKTSQFTRIVQPANGTFSAIVMQSTPIELSGVRNILQGKPVYTVYLRVGDGRPWILQYCLTPSGVVRAQTGPVINMETTATLAAPYPTVMLKPAIVLPDGLKYMVVGGSINPQGRFEQLQLLRGNNDDYSATILMALSQWEFRAAQHGGKPVSVQMLLAIPPDR